MGTKAEKKWYNKYLTKKGDGLDNRFLWILLATLAIGLLALFTSSYAVAASEGKSRFFYVKRQAVFMLVGLAGMFLVSRIDYRVLKKPWVHWAFMIGSIVLIFITLVTPGDKNNIHRWIQLPGLGQFQPTEIAKFAVILWYAYYLDKNHKIIKDLKPLRNIKEDGMPFLIYVIVQLLVPLGVLVLLIYRQPHLSCIILIGIIAFSLLYVGGINKGFFFLIGSVAAIGVFIISQTGYFADRMEVYLHPFSDPTGDSWQIVQSLYAIGSGGFFGVGLGDSRQKYSYVPEPENDFIFSIVCEEAGFVGALIVIALFVLLVWRGFLIAVNARDRFGSFLAFGTSMQIGIQALINIGVVSGAFPNTGISLPFFSSGGTSLTMLLLQVGVLLSVSRTASIKKVG